MKWVWRGLLLVLLVAVIGSGLFLVWLRTGLPPRDGLTEVPGLAAPVRIIRDENGVPHIFAESETDAYMALGFVHAQDRLFQMDAQRMLGAGRSAEVIGAAGLSIDRLMRTLGLYRQAEASYHRLPVPVRQAIDSYTMGVNAWLDGHDGALPIEYTLLSHEPEPWQPADSLVFARLMGLRLASNWGEEVLRTRMIAALGPDRAADLFPEAADPQYTIDLAALAPALTVLAGIVPEEVAPHSASNAWVIHGRRTETGAPILANDPHLRLSTPVTWYLARIVTPTMTRTGATIAGTPFTVLGHNGAIAWGLTTTGADTQDLVMERIDPDSPDHYLTPDGSVAFLTREEAIAVRGGDPVTLSIRETRHGPVISDADSERFAALLTEAEIVAALATPSYTEDDIIAEALYRLNRASDWESFREAMRHWHAPIQNILYADSSGTIGLIVPGRIPIRSTGNGLLPVAGWEQERYWTGYIPFDDLPQVRDPAQGVLINANNPVVGPDFPYLISAHGYEPPFRSRRISETLDEADGRHTVTGSEDLLVDTVSLAARRLLPLMLEAVDAAGAFDDDDATRIAEAEALLRDWPHVMDRARPEPLIFAAWLRELNRGLYEDELSAAESTEAAPTEMVGADKATEPSKPLFDSYWSAHPRAVYHMLTTATDWCDDISTEPAIESCGDVAAASLLRALDQLEEEFGADMSQWQWGQVHRASLSHQVLGRVPVLAAMTDLSIATDGGDYTVNRGGTRGGASSRPFEHVHGAGFRAVYDLSDLDASRFIIATGQSGNPLSPHYGDLVEPWRDGRMITISGSEQQLIDRGLTPLVLTPTP